MPSFYAHADVLLVTLKEDSVFEWTIPGKIQTYLYANKPIIGMLNGEGARVIQNAKAGFVCKAGEYDNLIKIIEKMSDTKPEDRKVFCLNARKYAEMNFNKNILLDKLNIWLNEITTK